MLCDYNKILVLSHGTKVIRNQWAQELTKYGQSVSSDPMMPTKFTVVLPQSVHKDDLSHHGYDLVIVDEAHQFYHAAMVQKIIKNINPKKVLALTATPDKFILHEIKPIVIPSTEVFADGFLADPHLCLIQSDYSLSDDSYNEDDELKTSVKETQGKTNKNVNLSLRNFIYKLSRLNQMDSEIDFSKKFTVKQMREYSQEALKKLGKTMIASRNVKQAKMIQKSLKALGVNCLISTYENDADSEEIENFKNDPNALVLIVVMKGILGFNFPAMRNFIDFTGSRNVSRVYQMYNRVTRLYDGLPKFYFKISYGENLEVDALYFQAAICLAHEYFISRYDGKNLKTMQIPDPNALRKMATVKFGEAVRKVNDSPELPKTIGTQIEAHEIAGLGLLTELIGDGGERISMTTFGAAINKLTGERFHGKYDDITYEIIAEYVKTGFLPEKYR